MNYDKNKLDNGITGTRFPDLRFFKQRKGMRLKKLRGKEKMMFFPLSQQCFLSFQSRVPPFDPHLICIFPHKDKFQFLSFGKELAYSFLNLLPNNPDFYPFPNDKF